MPDIDEHEERELADECYWQRELEKIAGVYPEPAEETMNPTLLKCVTHTRLVMVASAASAKTSGIHGIAFLCCGPGNDTCITQVHLVQGSDGRPGWRLPHVELKLPTGASVSRPVFKGRLAEEIGQLVLEMYDQIKKQLGKAQYGMTYNFAGGKVTVEEATGVSAG